MSLGLSEPCIRCKTPPEEGVHGCSSLAVLAALRSLSGSGPWRGFVLPRKSSPGSELGPGLATLLSPQNLFWPPPPCPLPAASSSALPQLHFGRSCFVPGTCSEQPRGLFPSQHSKASSLIPGVISGHRSWREMLHLKATEPLKPPSSAPEALLSSHPPCRAASEMDGANNGGGARAALQALEP